MSDNVLAAKHGPILVLTLYKPEKLNALDAAMLAEIARQLQAADADDSIAVTMITGTGRSFSTGFDMSGGGSGGTSPIPPTERLRVNLESFLAIWRAKKAVVAAVDGYALGAGCILANLCDVILASERSMFGEPEVRYWNPATITILPWIVGIRRAKQLLFYGRNLDARTAMDWGIVTEVLPTEGFFEAALAAMKPLALMHPAAMAAVKRSINRGAEIGGFIEALQAGLEEIAPLYGPDSPTATVYRAKVQELGFKGYIRHRDELLGG
jgi:enoyl-CoA hydratase/carnithine racemase